jgi:hypothetical protein
MKDHPGSFAAATIRAFDIPFRPGPGSIQA